MIIDLDRFCRDERPTWQALERWLEQQRREPQRLKPKDIQELLALYERTADGLCHVRTFAAKPDLIHYLENLCAEAYGLIHGRQRRLSLLRLLGGLWQLLASGFPRAFRRQVASFWLAAAALLIGGGFGAGAIALDPGSKPALMPFPHLLQHPSERVAMEESEVLSDAEGLASFSAFLMTHNIRVALLALALGLTFGVGTLALLFYNGALLGAVVMDYLLAGEGIFLTAWLLPHGSVEITAILIGGQAGFVLARALIDPWGRGRLAARLRAVREDLLALTAGMAFFLVIAGIVEAFISQYHEPALAYSTKIAIGGVLLSLAIALLTLAGRGDTQPEAAHA